MALVVGTHHHHDHVGGLGAFVAEHPAPVVRSAGAHRAAGLDLRVLPTPGHTADSVCVQLGSGELLTGDTVLGRGSTVIAADGDLGHYLASLDLLLGLDAEVLLPGHGPARPDAERALRTQLEHRRTRLDQVRQAWAAGHRDVDDLVEAVHGPLEGKLRWAAAQSIRAQLDHLGY